MCPWFLIELQKLFWQNWLRRCLALGKISTGAKTDECSQEYRDGLNRSQSHPVGQLRKTYGQRTVLGLKKMSGRLREDRKIRMAWREEKSCRKSETQVLNPEDLGYGDPELVPCSTWDTAILAYGVLMNFSLEVEWCVYIWNHNYHPRDIRKKGFQTARLLSHKTTQTNIGNDY